MTYGDSLQNSFETLCTQIFERFLRRKYGKDLTKFRVINGAGGDGGIEAYGELTSGDIIAVQAKWFRDALKDSEIGQIRNSVTTAKKLRPQIKEYIICIPRDIGSLKFGRGKKGEEKKPIQNHEEKTVDDFVEEMAVLHPDLTLTWWFEKDIDLELQHAGNEGIYKFWFDREVISLGALSRKFALEKTGWLNERYIPELHGQGKIYEEYQKLCLTTGYRRELERVIEKTIGNISRCIGLIDKFINSNSPIPAINSDLENVQDSLTAYHQAFEGCRVAFQGGNDYHEPQDLQDFDVWRVVSELRALNPDNLQKNTLPRLISLLEEIHQDNLKQMLDFVRLVFKQSGRLIVGDPGTGKTHGLANCVETHLNRNSPAVMIRAKGASVRNWTELFSDTLELSGWQKEDILSALEALATRADVHHAGASKPGEERTSELAKVLICIDGLDEDSDNFEEWYARVRESVELTKSYPRVRFVFSARRYFYDNTKLPERGIFDAIFLPHEGDVRILDVAPKYFSKNHYNIQLPSYSMIRGINSLLALRLFCDEYKNRSLSEADQIVTATRDLINLKIERINKEFVSSLGRKVGATRNPILDALSTIADYFYSNPEIEHRELVDLITPKLSSYFNAMDIDSLIDYLAQNAFLIRYERVDGSKVLKNKKYFYSITYQSLIEHIISEEIYHQIRAGSLSRIPEFLHRPMAASIGEAVDPLATRPNQRIIQNIVNNLLAETGQLIGENNFLTEGFDSDEITRMQLTAINQMPPAIAKKFKPFVDAFIQSGYMKFSFVIEFLILPSSYSQGSTFGAEYLHDWLSGMSSAFERDKIWSGFDRHELGTLSEDEKFRYQHEIYGILFNGPLRTAPELFEWNLHNDRPLVLAWGLSTIDQELRHNLRVTLTGWAIKKPSEFLLLLKKIFPCNDPQIHEDLASIALGVASRVKEKADLEPLAQWALENVFSHLDIHRNIIVRQGFRAIVERAYQAGAISDEVVKQCRPMPMTEVLLLPLEQNLETGGRGECYPIVHDLAWYVLGDSYDNFLELPSSSHDGLTDNDCPEGKALLDQYRNLYGEPDLFAYGWALGAAIAYIRGLGFTRETGNGFTDATHGSKSKVFTYEEKYTWLAVHHIQGYLSDYVPAERWNGEREFVTDYSQLTDIPNPAESLIDGEIEGDQTKNDWVIKEYLSKELDPSADPNSSIKNWVNEEPDFNPENWLTFESKDFDPSITENGRWTAIFNHTALHDAKKYCYSRIDARACLVKADDLEALKNVIVNDPDSLHFIGHLDGFHSSPQTDTYSNPTDIAWMSWIEEDGTEEEFFDEVSNQEKYIRYALTQVVQTGVKGEVYWVLPSKEFRTLIGCYDFQNGELKDANGTTLAFIHKTSDGSHDDRQELVLVDDDALKKVRNAGYEIVWFFEHFKEKNPLNKTLDKILHSQKVRKYFVWTDDTKKFHLHKFWDEYASNVRDKDFHADDDLVNPFLSEPTSVLEDLRQIR